MKKKPIVIFVLFVLVVVSVIVFATGNNNSNDIDAVIYKSPTCGCCVKYIPYLEHKNFDIDIQTTENMDAIKERYDIPPHMESCHTMIIGDYFVEGHIPIEAINKLLEERPDIDGIALPNMPSGTPGMPGRKKGDWIIYSIKNGEIYEFMTI